MTKQKRGRDYSEILLASAMLVTVARYAGAFFASDVGTIEGIASDVLAYVMGLTGIGMGVLDVIGGAYVFDGWRKRMPRNGQRVTLSFITLTVFAFGLIIVGIWILIPFTVSRVTHQSVASVLEVVPAGVWLWSAFVNIAPYLLIGGVVTAQSGVVTVATNDGQMTANDVGQAPVSQVAAANDGRPPAFARSYAGFVEYQQWLAETGRAFPGKDVAAREMGRSVRQIERYIEMQTVGTVRSSGNSRTVGTVRGAGE